MLKNLYVRNLALIDEAEIDFEGGLNILTGETGAGKSVLLGSIGIALGGKVPKDIVRDKNRPALVELTFEVPTDRLAALDIYPEDGRIVLSRRIRDGKSSVKINGETVSMATLREASALLIDIYGQHEHQSLTNLTKQMEILDGCGGSALKDARRRVEAAFTALRAAQKEADSFSLDEEKRLRELDLCLYEIDEIEGANLKPGEEEELSAQHKKFANARMIAEGLSEVNGIFAGDGSSEGVSESVGRAVRTLGKLTGYDDALADIYQELSDLESIAANIFGEIESYVDEMSFDEGTLAEIENRLDVIYRLKGKYGNSVEKVLSYLKEKKEQRDKLTHYDEMRSRAAKALRKAEAAYEQEAAELTRQRGLTAKTLEKSITAALEDLNFLKVQFEIAVTPAGRSAKGSDRVEFLISTNPGEPVRPLKEVASGGEMSRIMLAIKTIMAETDDIDTLIFDEIDTGISGRTAQMVAEKMAAVARRHQVLCITHLPQIAAMADTHYYIEKNQYDDRTLTELRRLSEEESAVELARMLGGVEITDSVLKNAKEMKELAREKKQKMI
ncbi:MAG: DNA repair protein RecN [Lachnospiraceae bacterium]|nr:DNA repair protein RecN [Lachnospiraceae bacterium]